MIPIRQTVGDRCRWHGIQLLAQCLKICELLGGLVKRITTFAAGSRFLALLRRLIAFSDQSQCFVDHGQ